MRRRFTVTVSLTDALTKQPKVHQLSWSEFTITRYTVRLAAISKHLGLVKFFSQLMKVTLLTDLAKYYYTPLV